MDSINSRSGHALLLSSVIMIAVMLLSSSKIFAQACTRINNISGARFVTDPYTCHPGRGGGGGYACTAGKPCFNPNVKPAHCLGLYNLPSNLHYTCSGTSSGTIGTFHYSHNSTSRITQYFYSTHHRRLLGWAGYFDASPPNTLFQILLIKNCSISCQSCTRGSDCGYLGNCQNYICYGYCGDRIRNGSEQCDDGSPTNNDYCKNCRINGRCGDGIRQSSVEQCDDGTSSSSRKDYCINCKNTGSCGDGKVQSALEQCDDRTPSSSRKDYCINCKNNGSCGDGKVQSALEQCDDRTPSSSRKDYCINCKNTGSCGDGKVQSALEQCDDRTPGSSRKDYCINCKNNGSCGDGKVQSALEQCDDRTPSSSRKDYCINCKNNGSCGDGKVQSALEQCDDRTPSSSRKDYCINCKNNGRCGDGILQSAVEQCDDGNNSPEDGCSASCKIEPGCICPTSEQGNPLAGACSCCSTDEECITRGDGNVCIINKGCKECRADKDCPDAKPFCDQNTYSCRKCSNSGEDGRCETRASSLSPDNTLKKCATNDKQAIPKQGACVQCNEHNHCTDINKPLCDNGVCRACTGESDHPNCLVRSQSMPTFAPPALDRCATPNNQAIGKRGQCVECDTHNDCNALFPICSNGSCVKCSGTEIDDATCSSNYSNLPYCATVDNKAASKSGQCVECDQHYHCTSANEPVCVDGDCTPCDTVSNGTALCKEKLNTSNVSCAYTGTNKGRCVECNTNSECLSIHPNGIKPVCDTTVNQCVCQTDAECKEQNLDYDCHPGLKQCVDCVDSDDCLNIDKASCKTGTNTCVVCSQDSHCQGKFGDKDYCAYAGGLAESKIGSCVQCNQHSDCNSDNPVCSNGSCVKCTGTEIDDSICSTNYSNLPYCATVDNQAASKRGQCVECDQHYHCRSADEPVCIDADCAPCDSVNNGSALCKQKLNNNSVTCAYGGNNKGRCVECASDTECLQAYPDGKKPVCDLAVNQCVCFNDAECRAQNPDYECHTGLRQCVDCIDNNDCPSIRKPYCNTVNNTCSSCMNDSHCQGRFGINNLCAISGGLASSNTGTCVQCNQHSDCNVENPICSNGQCVKCDGSSEHDGICQTNYNNLPYCAKTSNQAIVKAGQCVECDQHQHCQDPFNPVCVNADCIPCNTVNNGEQLCKDKHNTPNVTCSLAGANKGKCIECNNNTECLTKYPDGRKPVCDSNNQCVCENTDQCKAQNSEYECHAGMKYCVDCIINTDCPDINTPYCNTSVYQCQSCNDDMQCATRFGLNNLCATNFGQARAVAGRCVQCNQHSDCNSENPVCNSQGQCVKCDGGSAHDAICLQNYSALPYCAKPNQLAVTKVGECVECNLHSDCKLVNEPVCNLGDCKGCHLVSNGADLCKQITGNQNMTCSTNGINIGKCVECESQADCSKDYTKPYCNLATNTCEKCTKDPDCLYFPIRKQCSVEQGIVKIGQCTECLSDDQCLDPAKPKCNASTGLCSDCTNDSQCEKFPDKDICGSDGSCNACNTSTHACKDSKQCINGICTINACSNIDTKEIEDIVYNCGLDTIRLEEKKYNTTVFCSADRISCRICERDLKRGNDCDLVRCIYDSLDEYLPGDVVDCGSEALYLKQVQRIYKKNYFSLCGDGIKQYLEECDDGNSINDDNCNNDCEDKSL